jgi:flagellar biosynthesis protein FliQ
VATSSITEVSGVARAPRDVADQGTGEQRHFEIVPLRGLPIVAAIVVGLIVAIAGNWLWALDFFHVVGGGLWTGIDLFVGFVIGPILGRLSMQSRTEFTIRFMPKMVLIMPTLVTMTLGAGFQLARHMGNLSTAYPNHGWVVASFVVVGVMTLIALGLLEPANLAVLFELRKPEPDGAVIGQLMRRFIYCAGITGAMQVATLIIMTRLAT